MDGPADIADAAEPPLRHWFEALAEHMGAAYLRYSFTQRTAAEVDFLVDVLGLVSGDHVLDVGCGPGRHVLELATRGIEATGIDISSRFVELGTTAAEAAGIADLAHFDIADARALTFDGRFDAVIGMCQGAFGLQAGPAGGDDLGNLDADLAVLDSMRRAVRPGGVIGLAAFSAYFQVRHLEGGTDGTFDPISGTHHERTNIHSESGATTETDLWTTCSTPRELVLMARAVGLEPVDVWSVASGDRYERRPVELDEPEIFLMCRRPV